MLYGTKRALLPKNKRHYFVDATSGNDANSGTSPNKAWQTIAKISTFTFSAGDTVYLKRGEVWRELWSVNTGGSNGNYVKYKSYGAGAAPKITGCDLLAPWANHAGNVYVADYVEAISTFLLLEDDVPLTKVANIVAVDAAGKYFPDNPNDKIYCWCTDDADPDTHTMEIGARYDTVNCDDRNYVAFDGLHFHGAGGEYGRGFGAKPTWNTPSNIVLNNCEISRCFYNGVQLTHIDAWGPIENFRLTSCSIHDNQNTGIWIIGESAAARMTGLIIDSCSVYNNGLAANAAMGIFIDACANPRVLNCEIYDNNGSLDWSDNLLFGSSSDIEVIGNTIHGGNHTGIHVDVNSNGQIHRNIIYECFWNGIWIEEHETAVAGVTTIYNNTCYHNRHGLVFGPGATIFEVSGITIKNNIFAYNRRANVELNEDNVGPDYLNNTINYNCYQTDPSPDPLYEGEFRAEAPRVNKTFAEWKTYTSWDANSLNEDPLLTDPANQDFTLQDGSPCINAGVDVGLPYLGAAPDLGYKEKE